MNWFNAYMLIGIQPEMLVVIFTKPSFLVSRIKFINKISEENLLSHTKWNNYSSTTYGTVDYKEGFMKKPQKFHGFKLYLKLITAYWLSHHHFGLSERLPPFYGIGKSVCVILLSIQIRVIRSGWTKYSRYCHVIIKRLFSHELLYCFVLLLFFSNTLCW